MACARFTAIVNNPRALVAPADQTRFATHYTTCDACKKNVCRMKDTGTWRELFLQKVLQVTNDRFPKERVALLSTWERTLDAFCALGDGNRPMPPQKATPKKPRLKKARS